MLRDRLFRVFLEEDDGAVAAGNGGSTRDLTEILDSEEDTSTEPSEHAAQEEAFVERVKTKLAELSEEEKGDTPEEDDGPEGEEPPAPAEEEEPGTDPQLVEYAKLAGYTDEQIDALATAGLLEPVISNLFNALSATPETPGGETGTPATGAEEQRGLLREQIDKLKESGYYDESDPILGVLEMQDGLISQLNQRVNEIMESTVGQVESAAVKAEMARLDSAVSGLGEDYSELFGGGSTESMDRRTKEFSNRRDLSVAMQQIAAGAEAMGMQVPQWGDLFKQALQMKFGDRAEQLARTSIRTKIMARSPVNRPKSTSSSQANGGKAKIEGILAQIREEAG